MRIAGFVSKQDRLEVDYIKSVHLVSRWIHEMFEPTGTANAPGEAPQSGLRAGHIPRRD